MTEFPSPLDGLFHALSDPTRRAMLDLLAAGERRVGELAAPFEMSLAAASRHIRVLERAGLIRRTVLGRVHRCAFDPAALAAADAWLHRHAPRPAVGGLPDPAAVSARPAGPAGRQAPPMTPGAGPVAPDGRVGGGA